MAPALQLLKIAASGDPVHSKMHEGRIVAAKSGTLRERVSTPHPRQRTNEYKIMIVPKRG